MNQWMYHKKLKMKGTWLHHEKLETNENTIGVNQNGVNESREQCN
jgi:hypothetical protein